MSEDFDSPDFGNVFYFPGQEPPQEQFAGEEPGQPETPENPFLDLSQTETYAFHQTELSEWLAQINEYDFSGTPAFIHKCYTSYNHVAPEELGEKQTTIDELHAIPENSNARNFTTSLYDLHLDLVLTSPYLTTYQKADLLTITAKGLYEREVAVDGRKVVLGHAASRAKLINKTAKRDNIQENPVVQMYLQQYEDLQLLVSEVLPKYTRREWAKFAASNIAGKQVRSYVVATSILLTKLDEGDPLERARKRHEAEAKATAREETRKDAARSKAHKFILKAGKALEQAGDLDDKH